MGTFPSVGATLQTEPGSMVYRRPALGTEAEAFVGGRLYHGGCVVGSSQSSGQRHTSALPLPQVAANSLNQLNFRGDSQAYRFQRHTQTRAADFGRIFQHVLFKHYPLVGLNQLEGKY